MKSQSKIRNKIMLLGLVPVVLFLLVTTLQIIPAVRSSIMEEKRVQTKELARTGLSIINHYFGQEEAGLLTREQAQERALEAIRAIRFGELNEDYFWINDFHPRVVMHPFRPDLEGEDVSNVQDPDGLRLFAEFARVAQTEGAGYVPYQWQYYDNETQI